MNLIEHNIDASNIIQKELVMIIAKSRTCSACISLPGMLKAHISNLDLIPIYHIYVDEVDEFRGEHLIFSVPTVLIFSEGKELLRESRYINYAKIERLIEMYNS
jgi:hypothetical protein